MNRDEFESEYAKKYVLSHSAETAKEHVEENRDGEGYTDHHIDLCWKIERISCLPSWEISHAVIDLEW